MKTIIMLSVREKNSNSDAQAEVSRRSEKSSKIQTIMQLLEIESYLQALNLRFFDIPFAIFILI